MNNDDLYNEDDVKKQDNNYVFKYIIDNQMDILRRLQEIQDDTSNIKKKMNNIPKNETNAIKKQTRDIVFLIIFTLILLIVAGVIVDKYVI